MPRTGKLPTTAPPPPRAGACGQGPCVACASVAFDLVKPVSRKTFGQRRSPGRGLPAPPGDGWRLRGVGAPGRRGHPQLVRPGLTTRRLWEAGFRDRDRPPGRLLDLVAAGTAPVAGAEVGDPTPAHRGGMVGVDDRRLAPRGGAHVVAQHEHPAQQPGEHPPSRVHGHEVAPVGAGVQPPQPHGAVLRGSHPRPSGRRRERAVTRHARRLADGPQRVAHPQQGPVGHHQVHLHRLGLPRSPAGQQPRGRVGYHRPGGPAGRRLVGALAADDGRGASAQRGVRPHHLGIGASTVR